jgi:hypothetical protein
MPKWYRVEVTYYSKQSVNRKKLHHEELTQLLAIFADEYGGENSIWRLQIEAMQRAPTSEGCVFLPHL